MPELPEVETVRRGLEREFGGRRIRSAVIDGARTVRRHPPELIVDGLRGRTVIAVRRRGKYLIVDMDSGDRLVVHLRMSGQLRLTHAEEPIVKHTHAVFDFGDRQLRFVDPRTFGELFVLGDGEPCASIDRLGVEPLDVGRADFAALLQRRRFVKALLLDQPTIAGLGNIYTDELLFAARVRADRAADSLSRAEVGRLYEAMGTVLTEAIALRGSSLYDAQYVDLYGRPGEFQVRHQVYAREGEPCPRCGRPVRRAVFQQRSTHFCATCQR
ncbi:MAG: bifunctional DNA-formamidopyrimidine glycosylase/DNA-(apurinic or apyrimidinic site) lyase [Acidimicrobiia bacterium]